MAEAAAPAPGIAAAGQEQSVILSLVLCSRNDGFQGDPVWRLRTTLEYLASHLVELGRSAEVEVIVTDWGSEQPLRTVLQLSSSAAELVRFVTVDPELAREKQRDSPFAEVVAINAAVRRSRGRYVGRIDQDTLVGRRFLEWFFDTVDDPATERGIADKVMISNRRRVPYRFAARRPPFPVVRRYVDVLGGLRLLPRTEVPPADRYWECYIGIVLFHRDLWDACEGYDESFIYYGYMEFDLFLRLRTRYDGLDLGQLVGCAFFHLDHVPAWFAGRTLTRRTNVIRRVDDPPPDMRPNGPGWGLADHRLEPTAASGDPTVDESLRWRSADWPHLVGVGVASFARTSIQVFAEYAWFGSGKVRRVIRRRLRPAAAEEVAAG